MPGISSEIPGRQSRAAFFRPIFPETSTTALMLITPTFDPPVQASQRPRIASQNPGHQLDARGFACLSVNLNPLFESRRRLMIH